MIHNVDNLKESISDVIGWGGTIMAVSFPLLDGLQQWAQTLGACGGVVLLFITIINKVRDSRIKKLEIKKLEKEINDAEGL
jgi:hypothetical protein